MAAPRGVTVHRVAIAALALAAIACGADEERHAAAPAPAAATPTYVGAERCAACHAAEAGSWRGSDHARAMMRAEDGAVLGDFADASFTDRGATTTFARRDGRFVVRTEGPDGAPGEFEAAYTFGVAPLQQLLLALPGGRLQALHVAWDARSREAGGARWFTLSPHERVPPGDPLHWTKLAYSWNAQCADCHSTNVRKGYDPAQDAYRATWSDLSVACEACHGPGSAHAETNGAAPLPARFGPRPAWTFADGAPIAARDRLPADDAEIDACGPCHARRAALVEGGSAGRPFLDGHRPALLEAGLYEADGQIRDEVYEYGSFLQSRMYARGVRCRDCHDPHSLATRAPGNALCGQCHRAVVYAVPEHHHHAQDSAGAECAACHMPARTYMEVDVRRDHSFRVPRPDLSAAIGTPNVCNACHGDRDARWAADTVRRWYPNGRTGTPHYATAIAAGRRAAPGAEEALAALARDPAEPAIVRATAVALLPQLGRPFPPDAVRRAVGDPEPLVRLAAADAAAAFDGRERLLAAPLLRDPLRAVRTAAARTLAAVPPELWSPGAREPLAPALVEYRDAQRRDADRPEPLVNLGGLEAELGAPDAARAAYEAALRVGPWFVPAYVNLADLERAAGRDPEAERLLRRALEIAPDVAETHYALALTLVRLKRHADARVALERAVALAPDAPQFAFTLAVLRHELGDRAGALALVEGLLARNPGDAAAAQLRAEIEAAP